MDFSRVDILPILRSSMPCRFADMPPRDFELFVAQFFKDSGFVVEQIKHQADYGIDVIVAKDRKRTAIQVKRYAEANRVGVSDINQAVGGRSFYSCDNVVFITTSDFTNAARTLAQKTGVELWNWTDFQKRVSGVYLNGKSYQEFFGTAVPGNQAMEPITAQIISAHTAVMRGNYAGVLFNVGLSNRTAKNLDAQILGATYITTDNNQYSNRAFFEGYFMAGVIYAQCTVETCLIFDAAHLKRVQPDDKIILNLLVNDREHSLALRVGKPKPPTGQKRSACFVATAAFGSTVAPQVVTLRQWRDSYIRKTALGRLFIAFYYFVSPALAKWIANNPRLQRAARMVISPIIWIAARSLRAISNSK